MADSSSTSDMKNGDPANSISENDTRIVTRKRSDPDDDIISNQMSAYIEQIALRNDDDPGVAVAGSTLFKERRAKDVPCRFHDGFSGTCWKGDNCVYGHEKYTGGVFAKKYPDLALAASNPQEISHAMKLPGKPLLNREANIICKVTHVVSPSEFFIRPVKDVECVCTNVEKKAKQLQAEEQMREITESHSNMESYYYGFGCVEHPQGLSGEDPKAMEPPPKKSLEDELQSNLQTGLYYRKLQGVNFFHEFELVAARINMKWMRAVVLLWIEEEADAGNQNVRVQLLETGEKLSVSVDLVCHLPERFCQMHPMAFHCCLFGISPTWFIWCKSAVAAFKKIVSEDKEVTVIIKEGIRRDTYGDFGVFERRPYMVKMLVDKDGERVDVAQELISAGYGFQWNPFPFRPFVQTVVNPLHYDFLNSPVPEDLPPNAVSLENTRMTKHGEIYKRK